MERIILGRVQKILLEKAKHKPIPMWEIRNLYGNTADAIKTVEVLTGLGLIKRMDKYAGTYFAYNKETKTKWR